MNPIKGQYVRALFYNGTQAEGFVVSWSDEESILTSKDGSLVAIIKNTKDDLMLLEVMLPRRQPSQIKPQPISPEDLRTKKLKALAALQAVAVEEAKNIDTSRVASGGVRYANPFVKK
jgi:hypothetical protein